MIRRSIPHAGIQRTGNGASPVARCGGKGAGEPLLERPALLLNEVSVRPVRR